MTDGSSTNLLAVTQTAEETNSDDKPPPSSNWCLLVLNQIALQFYNDAEQDLSRVKAAKRSKPHDANALTSIPQHVTLSLLGPQLKNLIILSLTVAAATPILLHGTVETSAMQTIANLNAILIPPGEIS